MVFVEISYIMLFSYIFFVLGGRDVFFFFFLGLLCETETVFLLFGYVRTCGGWTPSQSDIMLV